MELDRTEVMIIRWIRCVYLQQSLWTDIMSSSCGCVSGT